MSRSLFIGVMLLGIINEHQVLAVIGIFMILVLLLFEQKRRSDVPLLRRVGIYFYALSEGGALHLASLAFGFMPTTPLDVAHWILLTFLFALAGFLLSLFGEESS